MRTQGLSPETAGPWRAGRENRVRRSPRRPQEIPDMVVFWKPKETFKTERVVNWAIGVLPAFHAHARGPFTRNAEWPRTYDGLIFV